MIRGPLIRNAMFIGFALITLTACATATPYQAADKGRGYSDEQLESDRFRVSFAGNSLTSRETVENYLLYRAAEITLEEGYDYFIVVERDTETKTTYRTTFDDFGRFSHFNHFKGFHRSGFFDHRFHDFGGFNQATSRPINRYTAYANIVVYTGDKPNDPNAYSARDIQEKLSPIVIPDDNI